MKKEKQFGNLILTFTDTFTLRYNDKGSGADRDGAYWHPTPPAGFHALGCVGVPNYSDINGVEASICVKAAPGKDDAIASPTDYTLIWADHGSGAHMDGSCWRPIAPEGYVALGDVFVTGYSKPALDDIVCIKKDLTSRAEIGDEIWADHGSGADHDIDTYYINAPDTYINSEKGLFAANTFVANSSYSKPTDAPEINCLNLPFPVEKMSDPASPELDSYNMPPEFSGKTIDRIVSVPFTAIKDDKYSTKWKVDNSPFYMVERQIAYQRELFDYNKTSVPQEVSKTVTTGITKSKSETFSVTTGISVTAESGVSFLGTGGKVSATISVELGWESTTGIEEFEERSISRSLTVPPSKAGALWTISFVLYIVRGDNTYLHNNLQFDVDSFVHDEYPNS